MGSSPPVCSFTTSLIQVAHVESRCATIIYMNGIENFLLRGREKKREGVRNGGAARREKQRGLKSERKCGLSEWWKEKERVKERRNERGVARASNGEGENLLAFYVSNYMKDGITQPTDRPTDRTYTRLTSPSYPFPNQPTNARTPLSAADRIPFSLRYSSLRLCPSCPLAAFSVSSHAETRRRQGRRMRERKRREEGRKSPFYASLCVRSVSSRGFNRAMPESTFLPRAHSRQPPPPPPPRGNALVNELPGADSTECNTTTRTAKKPGEAALPIVDPMHFIMHGAMS